MELVNQQVAGNAVEYFCWLDGRHILGPRLCEAWGRSGCLVSGLWLHDCMTHLSVSRLLGYTSMCRGSRELEPQLRSVQGFRACKSSQLSRLLASHQPEVATAATTT